jgi:hypothetical protein
MGAFALATVKKTRPLVGPGPFVSCQIDRPLKTDIGNAVVVDTIGDRSVRPVHVAVEVLMQKMQVGSKVFGSC